MKTQNKAVIYGAAALALAGLVIFSGATLGVFPITSSDFNPNSSALLSILLTDPPSVPTGVSAVYVTFSGLAVHIAGLGDSGWVNTGAQGTIETLGLVNLTQTISSGKVPTGTYNMVRLTISGVQVTFQGKNYSATVNDGKLDVTILGGLKLNSSSDAAAVVDIQPTVLNLGSQSDPQFVVTTGAKALQVPSTEVRPEMKNVGFRSSLPEKGWYRSFAANHSGNLTIGAVSLTSGKFSLTFSNPTSDPVVVRMIVIAPDNGSSMPGMGLGMLADSIVFAVGDNGTIRAVALRADGSGVGQLRSVLGGGGYLLNPNSSATFSFTGNLDAIVQGLTITPGSTYNVFAMGEHVLATETVTAS